MPTLFSLVLLISNSCFKKTNNTALYRKYKHKESVTSFLTVSLNQHFFISANVQSQLFTVARRA